MTALNNDHGHQQTISTMIAALAVDYDRLAELRAARDAQKSVIHGTMRPQDVLPALLEALRDADENAYEQFIFCGGIPAHANENYDADFWYDEAPSIIDDLFDALNHAIKTDGLYFGAHPDDGSDYGYWLTEDAADELRELEYAAGTS